MNVKYAHLLIHRQTEQQRQSTGALKHNRNSYRYKLKQFISRLSTDVETDKKRQLKIEAWT